MEPNTMAYLQYLTWSIDQLQADAATAVDIDSLAAATATDVDMASLTDATETTMIGTLTASSVEGLEDIIQIVDDPNYPVLTLPEGEWLVSSGANTVIEWSDYDTIFYMENIKIEDLNCSDGQFLTIQDQRMVCVTPTYDRQLTIIKEVPMWTISNILIVAIIAALVFKLMPKVTLFNFFKVVWKLVIRPFRRREAIVKGSWKHAEYATRGKEDKEV